MDHTQLFERCMAQLPLVAILRGLTPAEAPAIGRALWQAGWRLMEVPLNSPDPLQSIQALAQAYPDALVGAGTVQSPREVHEVQAAGGRLIVSPHLDAAVVTEALKLGLVCLPGVLTPSEALRALQLGAQGLKLFPAEMMPPPALKALRAVLAPQVRLLPVGGVGVDNMAAYRAAGASGFGLGSALYQPGRAPEAVAVQAHRFASAWATSAAATMGA